MNSGAFSAALSLAVIKSLYAQLSLELVDREPNACLKCSIVDHALISVRIFSMRAQKSPTAGSGIRALMKWPSAGGVNRHAPGNFSPIARGFVDYARFQLPRAYRNRAPQMGNPDHR